ncbi:phage tail protein [Algoriphagus sp. AK58]|uniref:phage tail protein n=1 Tax=Algoriphagus sp. AK58 TaxID=1406877 RepID=UPI0016501656|nr:tail fiber protein [Algoriphagus sp. AK58]MBC6369184.1 phage tail protein [Algoriphagus sp. AK58]
MFSFLNFLLMDESIVVVKLVAGNFAPKGWPFCNVQLLSISENTALLSIIGIAYGFDEVTKFALTNLSKRLPISTGHGTIGNTYVSGKAGGQENITLSAAEIPFHDHSILVNASPGNVNMGTNNFLASGQVHEDRTSPILSTNSVCTEPAGASTLNTATVTPAGGIMPHSTI